MRSRLRALRVALGLAGGAIALLGLGSGCTSEGGGAAPGDVSGPASDGLVFVRRVAGRLDLARARLADGALRPLTRTPASAERWPYWSDPARRVVFQRGPTDDPGRSDLWTWSPTAGEQAIAATPARAERWPAWSPVAPTLVFAFRGGSPAQGLGVVDFDAPVPVPRLVTRTALPLLRPSWSPDGGLWVTQHRTAPDASTLWLVELSGAVRPLTGDPAWFDSKARFTRSGRRVVYSRRPSRGGEHEVVSVDRSGAGLHRHAGGPGLDAHSAHPSPTRDEIVYVARPTDGSASRDLFRVDLAGGAPTRLAASDDLDEYAPRWSPDGERIVVTLAPAGTDAADRETFAAPRLRVLTRAGEILFETPGMMADWMPPW